MYLSLTPSLAISSSRAQSRNNYSTSSDPICGSLLISLNTDPWHRVWRSSPSGVVAYPLASFTLAAFYIISLTKNGYYEYFKS